MSEILFQPLGDPLAAGISLDDEIQKRAGHSRVHVRDWSSHRRQ